MRRLVDLVRVLAGVAFGYALGLVVGILILNWMVAFDDPTGFDDLAAVAGALISFGPLGAIAGVVTAGPIRLARSWWWPGLLVVIAAATAIAAGLTDGVEAGMLGAWAASAVLVVWMIQSRRSSLPGD
jgi:hypothetical protein